MQWADPGTPSKNNPAENRSQLRLPRVVVLLLPPTVVSYTAEMVHSQQKPWLFLLKAEGKDFQPGAISHVSHSCCLHMLNIDVQHCQ